ncbi:acyltransferase, partial [Singulisphaera rosea]
MAYRPVGEPMEGRLLLSTIPPFVDRRHPYLHPASAPAVTNPNRPILPAGASSKNATFIDPSARITNGAHVMVGNRTYIASYSTLNASTGFIKIGKGSSILSNASILSNPTKSRKPTTSVRIGDLVQVGIGATVTGPSTIGANGATAKPTIIGP